MTISEELEKIVGFARDEAMRTGNMTATEAHLLLAVLRHGKNAAFDLIKSVCAETGAIREEIEGPIYRARSIPYSKLDEISFSRGAGNVLSLAVVEAEKKGTEATTLHLLYAVCAAPGSSVKAVLARHGITPEYVKPLLPEGSGELQAQIEAEVQKAAQDAFARAVAASGTLGLGAGSGKDIIS